MSQAQRLDKERHELLREMENIRLMRRGTVNEQFLKVAQKDGSVALRGPYYLYSRTEKGKSISQRVAAEDVERYQEETENCRRFKELASRCVVVCEELAEEESQVLEKKRKPRKGSG